MRATHLAAHLVLVSTALGLGAPAQELRARPAATTAPGRITVDADVEARDFVAFFVTTGDAGGELRLPGIGGVFRLRGPVAFLEVVRGPRRVTLRVPSWVPGTFVHFQALHVRGTTLAFTNVATSAVVSLEIRRLSPPRPPQSDGQVNVGQRLTLEATLAPPELAALSTFEWKVRGDAVRDYEESLHHEWAVVPLEEKNRREQRLELYWLPTFGQSHPRRGGPVERTVEVAVDLPGCERLEARRKFLVERNGSEPTMQAEDWFCEYNHVQSQGLGLPPSMVLNEHADWHRQNDWLLVPACGPQVRLYEHFLPHHGHMVHRFEEYRALFGFAPLVEWDPATPIPRGPEIDHASRATATPDYPRPDYLTEAGGSQRSPCFRRAKLAEFADLGELSPETAEPWHFGVHFAIGGDMASTRTSPKDPVFWRFHLFIEQRIHQAWLAR